VTRQDKARRAAILRRRAIAEKATFGRKGANPSLSA
jgi:hypothetical protein